MWRDGHISIRFIFIFPFRKGNHALTVHQGNQQPITADSPLNNAQILLLSVARASPAEGTTPPNAGRLHQTACSYHLRNSRQARISSAWREGCLSLFQQRHHLPQRYSGQDLEVHPHSWENAGSSQCEIWKSCSWGKREWCLWNQGVW